MKSIFLLSLLVALVSTGCTTLRQSDTQYHVLGRLDDRGIRHPVTAKDREAVRQIVSTLGTEWRLQDRTASSFIPTVIASYSQDWNITPHPFTLVAFSYKDKIVVDLSHSSPEVGETAVYRARHTQLLNALREKFDDRAIVPPLMDYVRHVQTQTAPPPSQPQR